MKWLKKVENYFYDEDESPVMMYATLVIFVAVMIYCATLWLTM